MVELENTGERMIPEIHQGSNKYGAHLIRYRAASSLVKQKVVLDIACGTGYGSQLLAKSAKYVHGVDLSAESITYAKKHYGGKNIEYSTGNATDIPLDDNSIDVVVSFETIEHVADYQKFMREIKRVLKPGGILIISSPNSAVSLGGNDFHTQEFTLQELKDLISKYFKYQLMYHQTLWLYNTLLSSSDQQQEWQKELMIIKAATASDEETEFYLCVASDRKITTGITNSGVISEYHRQQPSMKREVSKLKAELNSMSKKLIETERSVSQTASDAEKLRQRIKSIENSKAWMLTRRLQKLSKLRQFGR